MVQMDFDYKAFGNETAREWLRTLFPTSTDEQIIRAFLAVVQSESFVDAQDAERAVAAAEIVALSHGAGAPDDPQECILWVKRNNYKAALELVRAAVEVIERIFSNSELKELWERTEGMIQWKTEIHSLLSRLNKILKLAAAAATPKAETQPAAYAPQPEPKPALASTPAMSPAEKAFNDAVNHVRSGDHANAIANYDLALNLDPQFVVAFIGRGTSNLSLGRFEEALADLNQAIDREPELAESYNLRAQIYFQLRNYGRCIADLTILLSIEPDRADAYLMRGLANSNLGRNMRSIEDYTRAIELDKNNINAYLHRARAYEKEGRYDLAGRDQKLYEQLASG